MTVMVLIGCTANLSVIILFSTNKGIMTRTTFLLRALAISDGIMASVGGTMFCVNSFKHTWVFGVKGRVYPTSHGFQLLSIRLVVVLFQHSVESLQHDHICRSCSYGFCYQLAPSQRIPTDIPK